MIREAKRSEVEEEIRRQVDVLMREELDLLKIVSITFCVIASNNFGHIITLTEFKRKYLRNDLVCRQLNVTKERREKLVKNGRRERKKPVRRKAKRRTKT